MPWWQSYNCTEGPRIRLKNDFAVNSLKCLLQTTLVWVGNKPPSIIPPSSPCGSIWTNPAVQDSILRGGAQSEPQSKPPGIRSRVTDGHMDVSEWVNMDGNKKCRKSIQFGLGRTEYVVLLPVVQEGCRSDRPSGSRLDTVAISADE